MGGWEGERRLDGARWGGGAERVAVGLGERGRCAGKQKSHVYQPELLVDEWAGGLVAQFTDIRSLPCATQIASNGKLYGLASADVWARILESRCSCSLTVAVACDQGLSQ